MILKLGMSHQGLKLYKVYINSDPGYTLITWVFLKEKGKHVDFSETIATYDLKFADADN